MAKPWYPFYHADYERKTRHLTMVEHGAYRLLLDHYYSNQAPLPANDQHLLRICRASAKAEVSAVLSVVPQFFDRKGDFWHHERADEEIARQAELAEIRANAGKKGGQAKAKQLPPQSHSHLQSHRDSEPSLEFVGSPSGKPKIRGTRLPTDFQVPLSWTDDANQSRLKAGMNAIDTLAEAREFVAYFTSPDCTKPLKKDWHGTFLTWCRRAKGFSNGLRPGTAGTLATIRAKTAAARAEQEGRADLRES